MDAGVARLAFTALTSGVIDAGANSIDDRVRTPNGRVMLLYSCALVDNEECVHVVICLAAIDQ